MHTCRICQIPNHWAEQPDHWICLSCYTIEPKRFLVPRQISKFSLFRAWGLDEGQARIADMIRHGFRNGEIETSLRISERRIALEFTRIRKILGIKKREEIVKLWRNGEGR